MLGLSLGTSKSLAVECNFSKQIGTCTGAISILRTQGAKPSFSAEIRVSSSASYCSKVEYYLDSTPHQTVLKNTSSDMESVFGTNPISSKNLSVSRCTTYEAIGASGSSSGQTTSANDCTPRDLHNKVERNLRESLQQARSGMAQAERNKREVQSWPNPDRGYLAKMDEFIAKQRSAIATFERALGRVMNCSARKGCVCPG